MKPLPQNRWPQLPAAGLKMIDSHCHLSFELFDDDLQPLIDRATDSGIERMIAIGAGQGLEGNERTAQIGAQQPAVDVTFGIHPHDAKLWDNPTKARMTALAQEHGAVGYGEIGLDYFYNHSEQDVQRRAFEEQCALAQELALPIIIHTRDAHKDTLDILKPFQDHIDAVGGLIHCFSEGPKEVDAYLDLGMVISFSGIVTFAKATAVQEAAKRVPLERLLVETDAPFLAPQPARGFRNEPLFVWWTAEKIAELKQVQIQEIAESSYRNTREFFGLK